MSLQTIIKLLKWLVTKLNKEEEKLESESEALTTRIVKLKKKRIDTDKDAATAGRMSEAVTNILEP